MTIEIADYMFDWAPWLEGETLATVTLDIRIAGVTTVHSNAEIVQVWVSKPEKRSGTITCAAQTASGRAAQRTMRITKGIVT